MPSMLKPKPMSIFGLAYGLFIVMVSMIVSVPVPGTELVMVVVAALVGYILGVVADVWLPVPIPAKIVVMIIAVPIVWSLVNSAVVPWVAYYIGSPQLIG